MAKFTLNATSLLRQPCMRDCPERAPGCAASCAKWAAYVKERDQDYAHRADCRRINDAVQDGYRRLAAKAPKRS